MGAQGKAAVCDEPAVDCVIAEERYETGPGSGGGGADPNTQEEPAPTPSLALLIKQLLHSSSPQANVSPTAFLIACGAWFSYKYESGLRPIYQFASLDPRLTQAMLLHGANIHAKDSVGGTALHWSVYNALYASPVKYNTDKEIITQLLDAGADPDEEEEANAGVYPKTAMQSALDAASLGATSNPDLIALLRQVPQTSLTPHQADEPEYIVRLSRNVR